MCRLFGDATAQADGAASEAIDELRAAHVALLESAIAAASKGDPQIDAAAIARQGEARAFAEDALRQVVAKRLEPAPHRPEKAAAANLQINIALTPKSFASDWTAGATTTTLDLSKCRGKPRDAKIL